jgi:hypothetical protein
VRWRLRRVIPRAVHASGPILRFYPMPATRAGARGRRATQTDLRPFVPTASSGVHDAGKAVFVEVGESFKLHGGASRAVGMRRGDKSPTGVRTTAATSGRCG